MFSAATTSQLESTHIDNKTSTVVPISSRAPICDNFLIMSFYLIDKNDKCIERSEKTNEPRQYRIVGEFADRLAVDRQQHEQQDASQDEENKQFERAIRFSRTGLLGFSFFGGFERD